MQCIYYKVAKVQKMNNAFITRQLCDNVSTVCNYINSTCDHEGMLHSVTLRYIITHMPHITQAYSILVNLQLVYKVAFDLSSHVIELKHCCEDLQPGSPVSASLVQTIRIYMYKLNDGDNWQRFINVV